MKTAAVLFAFHSRVVAGAGASGTGTCKDIKEFYREEKCCGNPDKATGHQLIPAPNRAQTTWGSGGNHATANKCKDQKKKHATLANKDCVVNGAVDALEQAGADVTKGKQGNFPTDVKPITDPYYTKGLCPVNVHWHLGAEHRSRGQYDESNDDYGPTTQPSTERAGFRCKKYDANNDIFTSPYNWKYCTKMAVGETYEVHWPHSTMGACGTTAQYQTPFYDGVFCTYKGDHGNDLPDAQGIANNVGVQAQVFTVVNDEKYYYPDLIRGMIVDGEHGKEITKYTGSTTGSKRNNTVCSSYSPITWQVDRTCHLISASSFDKMCADMLAQKDDMSGDTHPHGSRELVADKLSGDNKEHRRLDVRFRNKKFKVHAMVY